MYWSSLPKRAPSATWKCSSERFPPALCNSPSFVVSGQNVPGSSGKTAASRASKSWNAPVATAESHGAKVSLQNLKHRSWRRSPSGAQLADVSNGTNAGASSMSSARFCSIAEQGKFIPLVSFGAAPKSSAPLQSLRSRTHQEYFPFPQILYRAVCERIARSNVISSRRFSLPHRMMPALHSFLQRAA